MLEELANLVQMSMLSKAKRRGIDDDDFALETHEVSAWLFQPRQRPKGSVVKEIPLDVESGMFDAGFEDVAITLHNR